MGIFNPAIFNNAVFNTSSATPTAVVNYSGGFAHLPSGRRKTREEVRAERERFGILPAKVQKVVAKVVREERDESLEQAVTALHAALERKNIAFRAHYAEAMKAQLRRRRDQEDEAIAIVLLLH